MVPTSESALMRSCFSGRPDSACSVSCPPGLSRASMGVGASEGPDMSAGVAGPATTAVGGGGLIRGPAFAGTSSSGESLKTPSSGCGGPVTAAFPS